MKVVLFVGSHDAGTSISINQYLKPKLGIKPRAYKFTVQTYHDGQVYSQSSEEIGQTLEVLLGRLKGHNYIVCACHPDGEKRSYAKAIESHLRALGYDVLVLEFQKSQDTQEQQTFANTAYNHLYT